MAVTYKKLFHLLIDKGMTNAELMEKAGFTKADLKSSNERNNTDGDIMIRKIESFLDAKKLPKDKKELIV